MKGKKGIFGFIALPIVLVFIFIVGAVSIYFLVQAGFGDLEERRENLQLLDTTITTRTIVQYEIEPGYFVHDLIVKKIEENNFTGLGEELAPVLEKFNAGSDDEWYLHVYERGLLLTPAEEEWNVRMRTRTSANLIPPGVVLPQKDGENIPVILEREDLMEGISVPDHWLEISLPSYQGWRS